MSKTLQYRKGDIIVFTTGEYSDFGMCGYLVATEDLDLPALAQKFVGDYQSKHEWDKADPGDFPSWLVAAGKAMPVNYSTVHVGSYSDFSPDLVPPTESE